MAPEYTPGGHSGGSGELSEPCKKISLAGILDPPKPAAAGLKQQPTTFSPPLAMQQSIWDSVVNGNFIDAKIFAFSQRSHEPGRVDTPKVLFVNTHVLATACSYFRSGMPSLSSGIFRGLTLTTPPAFEFSDGIATNLEVGLPPGVEPFFEMEENDSSDDYDGPVEVPAGRIQQPIDAAAPVPLGKAVKAYIVKYTAYRTFVGKPSSLRCPLMNKVQPACDHLVYLLRGNQFHPPRSSRVPQCLWKVYLSVCR